MSTILVFQNNETAAMLVFQTNPVGGEPFSYAKNFLSSRENWIAARHVNETALFAGISLDYE